MQSRASQDLFRLTGIGRSRFATSASEVPTVSTAGTSLEDDQFEPKLAIAHLLQHPAPDRIRQQPALLRQSQLVLVAEEYVRFHQTIH